jgi:hypothetical protein
MVLRIQWLFSRIPSFSAVIEDGQLCFYSMAILATAWYDFREQHLHGAFIFELDAWIGFVGVLATLGYGILASDHLGSKMVSRDRAAILSVVIGLASITLALYVHHMVVSHTEKGARAIHEHARGQGD